MMKKLNLFATFALTAVATTAVFAQPQKNLSEHAVPAGGAQYTEGNLLRTVTTLYADTTYILDTKIYVVSGQTLRIQPGTVIKAQPGAAQDANCLVVARGGKIYAEGTKENPIIFTTIEDPLDGTYSVTNREKWGGVIILGQAYNNVLNGDMNPDRPTVNLAVANGEAYIEGLVYPDTRNHYGALTRTPNTPTGTPNFVDTDNSGVIRYVSIRHGGSRIGPDNEVNGLTLGSVGNGTVLEHIEVISNGDDGIEFFGGTANLKYANVMFCDDDYIDLDQGYSGKIQFVFGVMLPPTVVGAATVTQGDNGLEFDGNDFDGRTLVSTPNITNVTLIGYAGVGATATSSNADFGLELKEECAGIVSNSIIAGFDWAGRHRNNAPYNTTTAVNSVLFLNSFASGSLDAALVTNRQDLTSTSVIDDILAITTSVVGGLTRHTVTNTINPVPAAGTAAVATTFAPWETIPFFSYAPYRGAFEPGVEPWTAGWTYQTEMGSDASVLVCPTDIDNNGNTGFGDAILLGSEYGTSCF